MERAETEDDLLERSEGRIFHSILALEDVVNDRGYRAHRCRIEGYYLNGVQDITRVRVWDGKTRWQTIELSHKVPRKQ